MKSGTCNEGDEKMRRELMLMIQKLTVVTTVIGDCEGCVHRIVSKRQVPSRIHIIIKTRVEGRVHKKSVVGERVI